MFHLCQCCSNQMEPHNVIQTTTWCSNNCALHGHKAKHFLSLSKLIAHAIVFLVLFPNFGVDISLEISILTHSMFNIV